MKMHCFNCSQELEVIEPISRKEECFKCHTDIRCCRNCRFYDPKVYNECKETQADRILEKDRSNLCDFFKPNENQLRVQQDKEKALSEAESLFKGLKKS
jgi:hypothetical protein